MNKIIFIRNLVAVCVLCLISFQIGVNFNETEESSVYSDVVESVSQEATSTNNMESFEGVKSPCDVDAVTCKEDNTVLNIEFDTEFLCNVSDDDEICIINSTYLLPEVKVVGRFQPAPTELLSLREALKTNTSFTQQIPNNKDGKEGWIKLINNDESVELINFNLKHDLKFNHAYNHSLNRVSNNTIFPESQSGNHTVVEGFRGKSVGWDIEAKARSPGYRNHIKRFV